MKTKKIETRLTHAGRGKEHFINPPVTRAATILFDSVAHMYSLEEGRYDGKDLYYGRYGTSTTHSLTEALATMEGCDRAVIYPSGVAAAVGAMLTILKPGDHMLMTEGDYPNSKRAAEEILRPMQVDTEYYDPLIGAGIEKKIRPNTRAIYMESPASSTMEFQDIPAIVKVARNHNITTIIDNTWGTPLRFRPLQLGVDLVIQSATKHISGHSDVMMGVVSGQQPLIDKVARQAVVLGYCVSADEAYLALRGLRTMQVRMDQCEKSAREIAGYLKNRAEIVAVLHPEFDAPGKEIFARDFSGGNGVFSFVLNPKYDDAAAARFVDGMKLFGLGFSWGGFESLIVPQNPTRSFSSIPKGRIIRLSIGLENVKDLIEDLSAGFSRL
ncbi:MAG: cystathionine beta-lyase [Alphaproteobacteria bacterium]|nr:MAG: cystathionine beta-lyase [Alphaproteobacteria bacterium]